jgi:hypothetical protein
MCLFTAVCFYLPGRTVADAGRHVACWPRHLTVFAIPPTPHPRIKTHLISSRNGCLLLFLYRYKYTLSTTLNTHVDRYIRLECRRLYSV